MRVYEKPHTDSTIPAAERRESESHHHPRKGFSVILCQLVFQGSSGERGSQLRKCFSPTGLQAGLEAFPWFRIDVGGYRLLWAVPLLSGGHGMCKKQAERALGRQQSAELLLGLCLSSCFQVPCLEFLPGLPFMMEGKVHTVKWNKHCPPHGAFGLVLVFTAATETKLV